MFHARNRSLSPFLYASLLIGGLAFAPEGLTAQNQACAGNEHSQFDFWIGSWQVENAAGTVVGHNTIRRVTACFLHESYTTPSGYEGQSFNIYDGARNVWHQSWVDNGGLLLQLDGGLKDGSMVLQGPGVGQGGAAVINRITWSVVGGDPDHVRQLWETSADGGATWAVGFDGHYMRESDEG
jgi:hypothetical protein